MKGKSIIISFVAIIGMNFIFSLNGCIAPAHWRGWIERKVVVAVFDEESKNPISKATVTLHQADLPKSLLQKSTVSTESGSDGVAEFNTYFGAGGRKFLLSDEGKFGINGVLKLTAEGYLSRMEELSSLAGVDSLPIANKLAIHVRVNLIRKD